MRTTVVGRVRELTHLRELVGRATAGRGAILLVEGEPGVGKTTLLSLAAAEGRRQGARVLRGGGAQHERPVPFAAIASWLDAELAIDAAGTGAADRDFVMTEAVLDRVDGWCAAGPLVLLVDDLQWADPSSLLVLGRLGRSVSQLPLLLVAAYQASPHTADLDVLLRSLRARGAVSITLPPLPDDDIAKLVESLVGAPPGPSLRKLLAGAGGNPLYAMELLGALARNGRIDVTDNLATLRLGREAPARMPGTLLDLIRRRLRALSPPGLEALQAAAVLGPGFDMTELAAILGTPVISLWQPVSEAVAGGLLTDADGKLVFRHDLIRQALADELPAAAAGALQVRAARALAALGAAAERVAQHLVAGPGLAPDAADWLVGAADTLIVRAPELAAELLDRALAQKATELLRFQYARALLWAGRPAEAQHAVRSALPGGARAVTLRWLLAQAYLQRGQIDEALAEARDVLATVALGDDEAARFHGFAAQCLVLSGQLDAVEAAAEGALATPDPYANAYGLSARAAVRVAQGRAAEGLDLADRALAALGSHRLQPDRQFAPHLVRGLCLLELDRLAEADAACEDGRFRSERGGRAFLTWHHLGRARVRYLDGRWDDALAEIQAGLDAVDCLGVADALRGQASLIALHRGEADPYAKLTAHPDTSLGGRHWGFLRLSVRALALERGGEPYRALTVLSGAWDRGGCAAPYLAADLARLAAITGERSRVQPIAEALALDVHHPVAHRRGAAALSHGVATADPTLLLVAAEAFATAGQPLYEGYAYENAAAVLAEEARLAEARAALVSAMRCYERLDAAWDVERAQARLRRVGVRHRQVRRRPQSGWDALTDTERRITALVAEGRSNPDIATELYLSRRTVRNHVSHILGKLGLGSRVELAVSAYERGSL